MLVVAALKNDERKKWDHLEHSSMKTRTQPAILSFHCHSNMAENLTTLDLAEIENLLYKSRSLNMKQKKLYQYLS